MFKNIIHKSVEKQLKKNRNHSSEIKTVDNFNGYKDDNDKLSKNLSTKEC